MAVLRVIAVLFLLAQGAMTALAGSKTLIGTWLGSYVCGQGLTGLTLSIVTQTGSDFDGFFHFYPMVGNPVPKEGCYRVKGHVDDSDKVSIVAQDWITRPSGYDSVNLDGSLDILGANMTGTVSVPSQVLHSCRDFKVGWQHPKPTLAPACKGVQLQSSLSTPQAR